jgi:NADH-quinone oxidoreductase subunit F
MLTGWTEGHGSNTDLQLLDELTHALKLTSICGLGQVVPVPIASVLKHFREVVDEHLTNRRCPAGVCFPQGGMA